MASIQVLMKFSPDEIAQIDAARGIASRQAYIRAAVRQARFDRPVARPIHRGPDGQALPGVVIDAPQDPGVSDDGEPA